VRNISIRKKERRNGRLKKPRTDSLSSPPISWGPTSIPTSISQFHGIFPAFEVQFA